METREGMDSNGRGRTGGVMIINTGELFMTGIISVYMIAILVGFGIAIADYILRGISLYTIAKREGREYPWLAFVPFARKYLQGELAGVIVLKDRKIKNPGIWLVAMPFIAGIVSSIFYGILCAITFGILISMDYMVTDFSVGGVFGILVLIFIMLVWTLVYNAAYKLLYVLVDKQIFGKFTSENMAVIHAVLSVFLPLYEVICLFVMRNKAYNADQEPSMEVPLPIAPPPVQESEEHKDDKDE